MQNSIIDVLVVGSGGAGLTAALHAKTTNNNVTVLSKTYATHSQTSQAQGGINAALQENGTTIQSHFDDTYSASKHLGNKNNIQFFVDEAPNSIKWLDKLGLPFSRNNENLIAQRAFGAAQENRTCYSSDYTGLKILHTLYDNCIKEGIPFLNEYMLLNLIVEDGKTYGVTALELLTGEVKEIFAKTVILATGGYCNLYNHFTTNANSTTGDGIAAALRAGAVLSNMELVQFHPTALLESNILISESARAEGGYLVDEKEERFIDELKGRDEVARAIHDKIEAGGKVYLDLRHLSKEKIESVMPQEQRLAKEFSHIDICTELLPINPAAHYSMGGIQTNVSCETSIQNLYACGECAQTGIHGANRLGGNSLQEIITFGKQAGINASRKAERTQSHIKPFCKQFQSDRHFIEAVYGFSNQIDFYEKKTFMGKIFFRNIGLYRTDMNMKAVLKQIRQWQSEFTFMGIADKSKVFNKNLQEFIEFGNMLELSEIVTVSAISRCESRGSHYRSDHPFEVESYQKNSIAKKIDGILAVDFEEVS